MKFKDHLITPEQAKTLSNNYNKRGDKSSALIGKEDARSVWFSIKNLEEFFAYAKKEDNEVSGIRVYFGAYGNDDGKKRNLSTVFLVPTKTKNSIKEKELLSKAIEEDTKISPMNYGSIGNPPKAVYPQ